MKRWSQAYGEEREIPAIDSFLQEIAAVCRKHGMWIAHEDTQGAFRVVPPDKDGWTEDWLMNAHDAYTPKPASEEPTG